MKVHHTGMTVANMEGALAFWRDALGMEVVVDQESRGGYFEAIVGERDVHVHTVHLSFPGADGARVELFEFHSPARSERHRARPADVGFAHVCVVCEADLEGLVRRLEAAGGTLVSPGPVDIEAGANAGGRALYLRDPDGHVLELFEPPPSAP